MKLRSRRDVPFGAAVTIVALVLLATVVTGRDESASLSPAPEPAAPSPPRGAAKEATAATEDLDLARLNRPNREDANQPQDLFAARSWTPAAPAVPVNAAPQKPASPPAPSAPPLPFKYLGRKTDGDKVTVFLEKGEYAYRAGPGEVIDNTYRVVSIGVSTVDFVYLPLGTKQTLSFPPLN